MGVIDKFLDFIDEMIEKNIINESDVLKYDMLGNLYLLKKNNMNIDNFKNVDYGVREIEWLASKIFGYSNFIDSDVSVSDLDYMISQNISVDEFNTLNEYYNDSIPVFTKLTEYILDDKADMVWVADNVDATKTWAIQGALGYIIDYEYTEANTFIRPVICISKDRACSYIDGTWIVNQD